MEHVRSLKPSLLLNAYLFTTFIFDAVMLRTVWLSSFNLIIRGLFTASFISKFVLMMLEGFEKRAYFIFNYQKVGPEESSGFYGQSTLWWLHGIIVLGARQVLQPTDLYPVTKDMSSEELGSTFWKLWAVKNGKGGHALTKTLIRMFRIPVLITILPRLSLIGFTFCQALLLKRLLGYLSSPFERQNPTIGHGLIGAYAIVYLGIAVILASLRL